MTIKQRRLAARDVILNLCSRGPRPSGKLMQAALDCGLDVVSASALLDRLIQRRALVRIGNDYALSVFYAVLQTQKGGAA
jgi:hypothetical protein